LNLESTPLRFFTSPLVSVLGREIQPRNFDLKWILEMERLLVTISSTAEQGNGVNQSQTLHECSALVTPFDVEANLGTTSPPLSHTEEVAFENENTKTCIRTKITQVTIDQKLEFENEEL
jgi:hypothetical protein